MPTNLQKNEIYENVRITGFSSDGGGVCRIGGRAVFVPRALPGELWRVRIVKVNRTAVWGRGEELLEASPDRIEPACPAFGKCGGCATLHMTYACELRFKLDRLNDALAHIGGLSLRAEEILGADCLDSYRNKGIYNFAPGPVAGFYRARSHDVVPAPRCLLQPECFDRAAQALCDWMAENGVPAYDEETGEGLVRHLYLRKTGRDFTACIVAAGELAQSPVAALREACPELTGILLCVNNVPKNAVLTEDLRILWGADVVRESLCGAEFFLSPLTFFQVNTAQTQMLYHTVEEYAALDGKTVLDLYCGAGSIGLSVARNAKKLIGSDIVPDAVENARRNAVANGMTNAEYFCGDAGQTAALLAARGEKPDVIIVDPPRKGIDRAVIDAVCAMGPELLVYVSCDPGTLSRDLRLLDERGYKAQRVRAVDMFPRTRHVEAVVVLTRNI